MRIDLAYGDGTRQLMVPSGVSIDYLTPRDIKAFDDPADALALALKTPIGSDSLASRLNPRSNVLIVVADPTREGTAATLPAVVDALGRMGVGAARIKVLVARGTHRKLSPDEKKFFRSGPLATISMEEHDCDDASKLAALLLTRRGTPVRVNRAVRKASLVILLSSVSFHYFAGFGGGRKLILPGCSDRAAILANHRLSLVDENPVRLQPGCRPGNLEGNPVHEDMCEPLGALDHLFAINYFTDLSGRVAFVNAGDPIASHSLACDEYESVYRVTMAERARVVVLSSGGHPYDINLLQSHKALFQASRATRAAGSVLFFSECSEGVGSQSLSDALTLERDRFLAQAWKNYSLNNQTAVSLLGLTSRCQVGMVTELDAQAVRLAGITPVDNAEAFLAGALESSGADSITVIRHGSKILPDILGSTER